MSQETREPIIPYAGPTTPRRKRPFIKGAVVIAGSLAATAGAALVLLGSTTTRCSGSTRSARLIWETRQRQIDREIAGDAPADATSATTTTPDAPDAPGTGAHVQ
jgi:hypothetical protein